MCTIVPGTPNGNAAGVYRTAAARPPAHTDGTPPTELEVYATLVAAMANGCVTPPQIVLHARPGVNIAEIEFPQWNIGGIDAVDSWAAEFDATPRRLPGMLAVWYGFEQPFMPGWRLLVFTHLDLPSGTDEQDKLPAVEDSGAAVGAVVGGDPTTDQDSKVVVLSRRGAAVSVTANTTAGGEQP